MNTKNTTTKNLKLKKKGDESYEKKGKCTTNVKGIGTLAKWRQNLHMLELETFNKIKHKQAIGSKLVIKSQRDYFRKELHVIFPKKTFYK